MRPCDARIDLEMRFSYKLLCTLITLSIIFTRFRKNSKHITRKNRIWLKMTV